MDDVTLKKIFKAKGYSPEACNLAIRGVNIPPALRTPVNRLCVVRGIRYHPGFATELQCKLDRLGLFTRALNARRIMSNEIPEMKNQWDTPYCIWHPEVASEATYRELASRYPNLKYHVGRACAVAGYTDLYQELDLLPEVHIAEEARDNGSTAIFDIIIASPVKYSVMDDYTQTANIEHPRIVVGLNNDTAVRSFLERKQTHYRPPGEGFLQDGIPRPEGYIPLQWDITEDMNIDEFDSEAPPPDDVSELLYMPLPPDLPAINKDLLILMAAYHGDVDRYVRLRRPVMIGKELSCVLRGIYHNTFFAKWWSLQQSTPLKDVWEKPSIQRAINARFIMSNDLSRITPGTPKGHLPFCIWYPNLAEPETYRELARREPRMVLRVARACIIANYQEVYEGLGEFKPTEDLLWEAEQRPSTFYTDDLNRRAELHGGFVPVGQISLWKGITFIELARLFNTTLSGVVTPDDIPIGDRDMHGGDVADVGSILLNVCASEFVKKGKKHMPLDEVYKNPDLEKQPEMLDDLPYRRYLKYALRHNLESQQS